MYDLFFRPGNAPSGTADRQAPFADHLFDILKNGGALHVDLGGGTRDELSFILAALAGRFGFSYSETQIKTL